MVEGLKIGTLVVYEAIEAIDETFIVEVVGIEVVIGQLVVLSTLVCWVVKISIH